jgi:hypothetical protein
VGIHPGWRLRHNLGLNEPISLGFANIAGGGGRHESQTGLQPVWIFQSTVGLKIARISHPSVAGRMNINRFSAFSAAQFQLNSSDNYEIQE